MTSNDTDLRSILIADDHDIVREAVARALRSDLAVEVRTAASGQDTLAEIERHGSFAIVLLDVNMEGINGLEAVRKIVEANQPGAVVIFSGVVNDDFVERSIDAGVRGYVPKTQSLASLPEAIRLIWTGTIFVPFSKRLSKMDQNVNLNDKQLNVLRLVESGMSNKQIGHELGMSEVTVKMHLRNICGKLEAKNRTQAVIKARHSGLLK